MAVHDGFFVRSIMHAKNPYVRVLRLDFVVLGIDLYGILRGYNRRYTQT